MAMNDNEQKAKILEDEARKIDRYGDSLTPPAGFAALLREAAALMRERDGVIWYKTPAGMDQAWHKGHALKALPSIDKSRGYYAEAVDAKGYGFNAYAPTLDAAKAAAIAWVDGQEGE